MLRHCPVCGEAIYLDDDHEINDRVRCRVCGAWLQFEMVIEYRLKEVLE